MRTRSFRVAFSAILSALAAVVLILGSYLPTGQIGIAALASLFPLAAALELGWGAGLAVYAVSGLICMLFRADLTAPLLYCIFAGYYPVVRLWILKVPYAVLRWVLRLVLLNCAACAALFLFSAVVDLSLLKGSIPAAFAAANVLFLVYEFCITRFSSWYVLKLSPKIKRG